MKATKSASWFQRAAFSQVGQHRPLVGPVLERPVQLGEGEDGHVEVPGQHLQTA
jgi:hypothetical protein